MTGVKIRQVYYCINPYAREGKPCYRFKKLFYSWLTPEEARQMLDPKGMRCVDCGAPMKWVRSEPLYQVRPGKVTE